MGVDTRLTWWVKSFRRKNQKSSRLLTVEMSQKQHLSARCATVTNLRSHGSPSHYNFRGPARKVIISTTSSTGAGAMVSHVSSNGTKLPKTKTKFFVIYKNGDALSIQHVNVLKCGTTIKLSAGNKISDLHIETASINFTRSGPVKTCLSPLKSNEVRHPQFGNLFVMSICRH